MKKRGQIMFSESGKDSPRKAKEKQHALKTSIREGSVANVSTSLGDSYIVPFALLLNAKPIHIGLLSSLSGFLSPIAQILGARKMESHSRKTIVMRYVLLQSLMWIPLAILGWLYYRGMFQSYSIYALIVIYSLAVLFGGIASPAWFSWMGDLVPEKERGSYFGLRNRTTGFIGLAAALLAAFALDAFKTQGLAIIGFSIMFFLAFVFRFMSFIFFHKQFSPKFKLRKKSYFTVWAFLKRMDNFGRFSVYQGFFYLALMIASPFFAVYMLKELNYSYTTFMIVTTSSTIFYLVLQPLAGKFSDRFGNKKLLIIGNICFALYPLFWLFMKNPIWIILVPQLISGIANAAWTIGTTNFVYASANNQHRGICVSYANLFAGIGTLIGALLGGFLVNSPLILSLSPFFLAFIASASLRLLSGAIFLPRLKEGWQTKPKKLPRFHHMHLMHPIKSIHNDIVWFKAIFR